jgi:hypothetical protein
MLFIATRFEHDGEYAELIEAPSISAAQICCERNGWRFDGSDVQVLKNVGNAEADKIIAALNERDVTTVQ